jgi:hypothetical protein
MVQFSPAFLPHPGAEPQKLRFGGKTKRGAAMCRNTILSLALFSLLALAGAATAAETPATADQPVAVSAPAEASATPAEEVGPAELCQALDAANTNVIERAAYNYECPPGRWYCQRNSQCKGFCGPGQDHFAVCSFGCCACAG